MATEKVPTPQHAEAMLTPDELATLRAKGFNGGLLFSLLRAFITALLAGLSAAPPAAPPAAAASPPPKGG